MMAMLAVLWDRRKNKVDNRVAIIRQMMVITKLRSRTCLLKWERLVLNGIIILFL